LKNINNSFDGQIQFRFNLLHFELVITFINWKKIRKELNNMNQIKQEQEEKIKTEYQAGGMDETFCPNCKAHIGDGHNCDNCAFCGS